MPTGYGDLMRTFTTEDFQTDPGYAFRQQEGQRAIESSAAARGGALSGGAVKEAMRYNSGLASQEYGNAWNRFQAEQNDRYNRLASIAGVGQTAANTLNQQGQNYANSTGNILMDSAANQGEMAAQAANARASGYMGSANAWNQALGGIGNNVMQGLMLSQLFGGGASPNISAFAPASPMPAGWNTLPY
jgi:hypothetical protein